MSNIFKLFNLIIIMTISMKTHGQDSKNFDFNDFYNSLEIQFHEVDDATISVRKTGNGPALVFIHGYMVNGYKWRYLIPELSKKYRCYIIESAGFGDTKWTNKTKFSFTAHKDRFLSLFKMLSLSKYSIIAHDTGGSIARMIAISEGESIENLILFDTEIPNHRPPFIRMFSTLSYLPFTNWLFRQSFKSKNMVNSKLMFREFYDNKKKLNIPENLHIPYLKPLIESRAKMKGSIKYLRGIEWKVIDRFEFNHKEIKANTFLIWGENDTVTFPVRLAKEMVKQFNANCSFNTIPNSKVMPHEENPSAVLIAISKLLK